MVEFFVKLALASGFLAFAIVLIGSSELLGASRRVDRVLFRLYDACVVLSVVGVIGAVLSW